MDYSDTKRRAPIPVHAKVTPDPDSGTPSTLQALPETDDVVTGYNNKARDTSQNPPREAAPYLGKPSPKDYAQCARHFGGATEKTIRETFKNTTQLGKLGFVKGLKMWRRLASPNPALNVFRRNEPVATDTIYGPEPAIDNGSTAAQFFIGRISGFCAAEGLGASDHRFPIALMNHI